jgi:ketosteroid isomerase-like protein
MSQENVEIGREMVDAFDRRDLDALLALVRPDVEWDDTEG